jgi:hypothetical protein
LPPVDITADTLLAGLIRFKRCGRKLTVRYTGMKHHIPRYSCSRGDVFFTGRQPMFASRRHSAVADAIGKPRISIS